MEKIQLIHPEGKKAPAMDPTRYAVLRGSFLACLAQLQPAPFQELLQAAAADLEKQQVKLAGKLEWHLFWVSLDLESRQEIRRDRRVSPIRYSLA